MGSDGEVMLGQKVKDFKSQPAISLEDLVPKNNFYRHVEAKLDLSFVREFVQECYATTLVQEQGYYLPLNRASPV